MVAWSRCLGALSSTSLSRERSEPRDAVRALLPPSGRPLERFAGEPGVAGPAAGQVVVVGSPPADADGKIGKNALREAGSPAPR
ncbi:hypothetical protein ACIBCT_38360 [Streptosporangium sp. NPDC050855]|uniref:hypothetical protein n=1 Tax=Streptosporangium sp. NPDC050855 TaxID=3366194 RepID=UPI0037942025